MSNYYITIFGITVHIDPVAFTLPIGSGFSIYWYGILIAFGCALAMLYAYRRADDFGIDRDRGIDVVIVSLIFGIIGARAYYLIFDGRPISSFSDVVGIHNGGLAIYGGVIGAFAAAAVMCRIRKVNFLSMADLAALGFLIGQSIGRWGNFVNQEAYGSLTGSDTFGMTGNLIAREIQSNALVHPCFLYESVWCLIGFLILHTISKNRRFKGQIIFGYMMWYGLGRFFIEGLRTDSLKIGNLRVSQVLSVVLVIVGAALYLWQRKRSAERGDAAYEGVFEPMDADDEPDGDTKSGDGTADSSDVEPNDNTESGDDEPDSDTESQPAADSQPQKETISGSDDEIQAGDGAESDDSTETETKE
jgi:phosphatidylglycerol:prolipoprotein diacylglycerol transferase